MSSCEPSIRVFQPSAESDPSNIYVVSYRDGRVQALHRRTVGNTAGGSRFCYIVDTAERRVTRFLHGANSVDAYSFTVEVEATWKVTDPEAVVRAGLSDGNEVVLARLKDELWVIGRELHPENAAGAEAAARSALSRSGPGRGHNHTPVHGPIPGRRPPDHGRAGARPGRPSGQPGRSRRWITCARWSTAARRRPILLHLLRHPDDTATVLQMMADARDKNQAVRLGLLDRMLEQNLITDADAQPLRDSVLGQTTTPRSGCGRSPHTSRPRHSRQSRLPRRIRPACRVLHSKPQIPHRRRRHTSSRTPPRRRSR